MKEVQGISSPSYRQLRPNDRPEIKKNSVYCFQTLYILIKFNSREGKWKFGISESLYKWERVNLSHGKQKQSKKAGDVPAL